MSTMPRTRAEQAIRVVKRRLAAGEIDAQTARELTSHIREAETSRIWAAVLNSAQAARHG